MKINFSVPNATVNIRIGRKTSTLRRYTGDKWIIHDVAMRHKEDLELYWIGTENPYLIAEIPQGRWRSEIIRLRDLDEDDLGGLHTLEGFNSSAQMHDYLKKLYGYRYKSLKMIQTTWEAPA